MNQSILLSTPDEALSFLDEHQLTKEFIGFDLGPSLKTLQILIEGDQYNGQLTGEIARALGQYQDAIYNFARLVIFEQPNARLTIEQKKRLELLIEVDEGSLDLKVNFEKLFDALKEPLSKMSPIAARNLVIALALLAAGGLTSYALGARALTNADRANQREHVEEVLKTSLEAQNKVIDRALGFLEISLSAESPDNASYARAAVASLANAQAVGLTEIAKAAPDAEEISFGESKLDREAIKTINQRSPRAVAEQFNAEGSYSVLAETLPGSVTKVTFHGKDLPGEITVDFIESEFSRPQADALWAAIRERVAIKVKLQATLIRGTVKGGVLIDILTD